MYKRKLSEISFDHQQKLDILRENTVGYLLNATCMDFVTAVL